MLLYLGWLVHTSVDQQPYGTCLHFHFMHDVSIHNDKTKPFFIFIYFSLFCRQTTVF